MQKILIATRNFGKYKKSIKQLFVSSILIFGIFLLSACESKETQEQQVNSPQDFFGIKSEDLHDSNAADTFVINETIVTFKEPMTLNELHDFFDELGFLAQIVQNYSMSPTYRIRLLGTENVSELEEKMALIESSPQVEHANKHWVGGVFTFGDHIRSGG